MTAPCNTMKPSARLVFDGSRLGVEKPGAATQTLRWDEVKEIFAFKIDAFAYDIICIGFRLDDEGTYFGVDEEQGGYADLVGFLPTVFPGIRTDWFSGVAFPAFAACMASIWGEEKMESIRKNQP